MESDPWGRSGGTTPDVRKQLRRLPPDPTHLIVSAGGNDDPVHIDFPGAPAPPPKRSSGWPTSLPDSNAGTKPR